MPKRIEEILDLELPQKTIDALKQELLEWRCSGAVGKVVEVLREVEHALRLYDPHLARAAKAALANLDKDPNG